MKKIISWLLVIAMTAAIAVGGTMAYLTDTDEDVNVMTVGKVKIEQLEYERVDTETKDDDAIVQEFHDNKPLYPAVTEDGFDYTPGDPYVDWEQIGKDGYTSEIWDPEKINNELDKMVFIKNKGDYDAYVRSVFAFEANGYTLDEFKELFHLNINETDWTWEWVETPVAIPGEDGATTNYIIATATYNKVLKPGELTEISLSQIALDPAAGNEDILGFGDTYQVLVKSQAVQAEGFADADTALNDAFEEITADNVPFETDSSIRGIDLRTALHYLNGNKSNQITRNVTNVIYALNKEYPEIVDEYDGTLVDVEQDVDVYAYYVPNGSNYDVYFLADDTIYSPKDSSGLYKNMRALQYVDTHNYDVSRVENMHELFRYCHSLKEIDVSHWDTGNVTDMFSVFDECRVLPEVDVSKWDISSAETTAYMFYGCSVLKTVDVSDWDVSNVITMRGMFENCVVLNSLDVSDWDTGNVTDMGFMFKACLALEWIDVGDWDVGNVTAFNSMFSDSASNAGRMKINNLDFSKWDTSNATNMGFMFYGCGTMETLDLSTWDVSKNTTFNHTFTDCYNLKSINFSGWDTSSVEIFAAMFNNCNSLEYLDISSFDTENAIYFNQMFEYCDSLKEIKGLENFNTSNVISFYEMFSGCGSLTELNLSSFNTAKVADTFRNFNSCGNLKTIYVGDGWDMSQVTSYDAMFSGCNNLVGGKGTTFVGSDLKYAHVDGGEGNPGYLTHINDKPVTE